MAIKLLIGGSPCTHWSIAQKKNRETKPEGLGWELFKNYFIAKEKFQPDFFLYENNKSASRAVKDQIAKELGVGVDPEVRFTYLNSKLVSAQNRQRFYVTNFGDIEQPEDRGILLKDILETGEDLTSSDKSYCMTATYNGACGWNTIERKQRTMVAEPIRIPEYGTDKARPINAHYSNNCGGFEHRMFSENPNKQQVDMIAEPINTTSEPIYVGEIPGHKGEYRNGKQPSQQYRVYSVEGESVACDTDSRKNIAEPVRAGCLPSPDGTLKDNQSKRIYNINGKSVTLSSGGGGLGAQTGLYAIPINPTVDDKAHTLTASYYKIAENPFSTFGNEKGRQRVAEPLGYTTPAEAELFAIKTDEPMRVKEATKQGYVDINNGECVDLTQPNSKTRRGRSLKAKSNCLTTSHQQYEYCGVLGYAVPVEWDENGTPTKARSGADGKVYTVYEVKDGLITIKGKQYPIKLIDGYYIIRKLTVKECCRLQTMPDDYCKAVSDSQAYKGLGNGWTAEVIIHLLHHALKDVPRDEEIIVLSMYDGIGTGRYCLDKMGFTNVKYYAYEIDKYPIAIAMDNYPDIIQCGDAFAVREDGWRYDEKLETD